MLLDISHHSKYTEAPSLYSRISGTPKTRRLRPPRPDRPPPPGPPPGAPGAAPAPARRSPPGDAAWRPECGLAQPHRRACPPRSPISPMRRTATCGDLRVSDVGRRVILQGWVHRRRDHGGTIFVDLRDRYGLTQCVFSPQVSESAHAAAQDLRAEFCVEVDGIVQRRLEGKENSS